MKQIARGYASVLRPWTAVAAVALLFAVSAWSDDTKKPPPPAPAKPAAAPVKTAPAPVKTAPARSNGSVPAHTTTPTVTQHPNATGGTNRNAGPGPGTPTNTRRPALSNTGGNRPSPAAGRNLPPTRVVRNPSGAEAHIRPDGHVQSVQAHGMTITHGSGGRMVVNRPDHSVIVTNRVGHGYVQRPFSYRGKELVNRTYYVRGVAYARYYRPYSYHGVMLYGYVPVRYYSPAFYGWVYNPWAAPVYYTGGWGDGPWLGFYGGYFAPAPFYRSPALWLTDYVMTQQLSAAYQERQEQGANPGDMQQQNFAGSQLTPDIKDAIAAEVQRQLSLENQDSQLAARNEIGDPASPSVPRSVRRLPARHLM